MRQGRLVPLLLLALALALGGCIRSDFDFYTYAPAPQPVAAYAQGGPYVPAMPAPGLAAIDPAYILDSGDRVRVSVYGQEGLTVSTQVDAGGFVSLSLIGPVPARGLTTQALADAIAARLREGYLREPRVAVDIEAYRPFFILGEVTAPGQYPYVANMTAETAIAIAGGYSPRADKGRIGLTRNVNGQMLRMRAAPNMPVRPGDTITVAERWL